MSRILLYLACLQNTIYLLRNADLDIYREHSVGRLSRVLDVM